MAQFCTRWSGIVQYRIVQCYTLGLNVIQYGTVWYIVVQYGTVWYSMVQCGTVWYIVAEYGTVWYIVVQYGTLWYGLQCLLSLPIVYFSLPLGEGWSNWQQGGNVYCLYALNYCIVVLFCMYVLFS